MCVEYKYRKFYTHILWFNTSILYELWAQVIPVLSAILWKLIECEKHIRGVWERRLMVSSESSRDALVVTTGFVIEIII